MGNPCKLAAGTCMHHATAIPPRRLVTHAQLFVHDRLSHGSLMSRQATLPAAIRTANRFQPPTGARIGLGKGICRAK